MTKDFDIVIFGASGFTGQFVVEEVARVAESEKLKWAIAGRSMPKLQQVLKNASKYTGKDLEDSVEVLMADVSSQQSLIDMAQKAKLILNCVGPYRFWGEDVVRACVEHGTHHVDISGEPQFLERMQLLYHGKAKQNGCYVVGACGFDSIPAEMGVLFLKKNFKGDLNEVENYACFESGPDGGGVNFGTFQSAIYGFAHAGELKELRQSLFPTPMPKPAFKQGRLPLVFHSDLVNGYCLPFLGSDRSVVQRSQRYLYEERKKRPVQFNAYFRVPSFFHVIGMAIFAVVFGTLAKFAFGRKLLETFPRFFSGGMFSKNGPTRKQISGGSFTMTMKGRGWADVLPATEQHTEKPEKVVKIRIVAPEAGYVTTPICMVQAALCILKEGDKLPPKGGVYPPGAAFEDTTLIERLQAHKVEFKVL